jgi:hypothetical protein
MKLENIKKEELRIVIRLYCKSFRNIISRIKAIKHKRLDVNKKPNENKPIILVAREIFHIFFLSARTPPSIGKTEITQPITAHVDKNPSSFSGVIVGSIC